MFFQKGIFWDLEEKTLPRNLNFISKGLGIYRFIIFEYYVSNESGLMIALKDQAYYVPDLLKYLRIIKPQGI